MTGVLIVIGLFYLGGCIEIAAKMLSNANTVIRK